jgi:hypothetical protein
MSKIENPLLLGKGKQNSNVSLLLVTDKQENGYCRGYYYSPNNTKTKKPIMH